MNLPFVIVRHGKDNVIVLAGLDDNEGLIGFDPMHDRILSFDVGDVVGAASLDPAATFFGMSLLWRESSMRMAAEEAAPGKVSRFTPKGYRFTPLFSGDPFSLPVSGYPDVRAQLLRHRAETPSVETIRLSAVFAGSSIMVGIEQAEKSFACIVALFEDAGRTFASLEDIKVCIYSLGLHELRQAMYSDTAAWAPVVREAMASGMRDAALRKHLYMRDDVPAGLSLAKISFTLALLGQDTICLDARLMNRMFGEDATRIEKQWGRPQSALALARYEAVEDAFLKGNPYYRPNDPIGRARAQWTSWESVGGAPASHSVWLNVVSAASAPHAVGEPSAATRQTKRKFPIGTRVKYDMAGALHNRLATVEHVRNDGNLVIHFDGDPPGAILVAYPTAVSLI